MSTKALRYLKQLQSIPSSPFSSKSQIKYVTELLDKFKVNFQVNDYSIIARPSIKPGKPKLILLTHLDHPGMVIKNQKEGIFFGSVGFDRLKEVLKKNPIPIKIFDDSGNLAGSGEITKIKNNPKYFEYSTEISVRPNFTAQYDFPYFSQTTKLIKVYNADNAIDTAVMLSLLEEKIETEFDLYFVFNLHEEVHQISAWHLAGKNILNLTPSDLVLNLEAPLIENASSKYSSVNYEDGVVLKVSNLGCVFGYRFPDQPNLTEVLVRQVAKRKNIPLQVGVTKGSDESRPFSYFKTTPNICTLAIPNRFKHNWGPNGEITPEIIYRRDITSFFQLLSHILKTNPGELLPDKNNLGLKVKKDKLTNHQLMNTKAILNRRLAITYLQVIKRGYYFPVSPIDILTNLFYGLVSYFIYFAHKVRN